MPRSTWGRWLKTLFNCLRAPGHLIFTTHGLAQCGALGLRPEDLADGFWFTKSSEQQDLDTADYGSTITLPNFVIREIYRETGAPVVLYEPAVWPVVQDLWVIERLR
jgi:hypothetical protein